MSAHTHTSPRTLRLTALRRGALVGSVLAACAGALVATAGVAVASPQPPARVTTGAAVVSSVTVNGGTTDYTVLSTPGGDVTVSGRYVNSDTSGAIDQIEIGWAGSSAPLGCIYDASSQAAKGKFTFDLGAPPSPRASKVIVNFAQDFSCDPSAWWTSNRGPAIAEVAVPAAPTGKVKPLTVSQVVLDGTVGNVLVTGPGTAVTARGTFKIADTGGVSDFVVAGWLGSSAPTTCLHSGPSRVTQQFTASLGAPPATGANYVVFSSGPGGCDLSGWPRGSSTPPTTISAALVYVDRDR